MNRWSRTENIYLNYFNEYSIQLPRSAQESTGHGVKAFHAPEYTLLMQSSTHFPI